MVRPWAFHWLDKSPMPAEASSKPPKTRSQRMLASSRKAESQPRVFLSAEPLRGGGFLASGPSWKAPAVEPSPSWPRGAAGPAPSWPEAAEGRTGCGVCARIRYGGRSVGRGPASPTGSPPAGGTRCSGPGLCVRRGKASRSARTGRRIDGSLPGGSRSSSSLARCLQVVRWQRPAGMSSCVRCGTICRPPASREPRPQPGS